MVNPIYILIIALGAAFVLPLLDRWSRNVSLGLFYSGLILMSLISLQRFYLLTVGAETMQIFTAGLLPPFSINLRFGLEEALFTSLLNVGGLLAAYFLLQRFLQNKVYAMMLFLAVMLGVNGIVMTRDLFNLFVFLEITSIATYALIGMQDNARALSAGFKYIIAGGLASIFFLLGTIFLYRVSGTLNIDMMAESGVNMHPIGMVALFLLFISLLIELKPFPINGWALDVYQAADSGIVSLIAAVTSGAMFYAFYKVLPLLPVHWIPFIGGIGMLTFFFSNLMGLKQTDMKRLLGYSSVGQMGLLVGALALILQMQDSYVYYTLILVVTGLFMNHFFAKAGLFWLAGIVSKDGRQDWALLHNRPGLLLLFGMFIFALIGLPPFPGFWAKWELVMGMVDHRQFFWLVILLLGSLFEVVYMLRWFGKVAHATKPEPCTACYIRTLPIKLFGFALLAVGIYFGALLKDIDIIFFVPIIAGLALNLIDGLSMRIKSLLGIGLIGWLGWQLYPMLEGVNLIFGAIFLVGAAVQLIAFAAQPGKRYGLFPLLMTLISSLGILLVAKTTLEFFFMWELMTVSSYLLILRGKKAQQPALWYAVFSIGGAFLILTAFGFVFDVTNSIQLSDLLNMARFVPLTYALLAVGFLVKLGALGLHMWLPGSYAEAEDDVSSILSSVLSKVGLFGLFVVMAVFGNVLVGSVTIPSILGWIGAATALIGAMMAVFQEDIKYTLAYSSMSQVGYMVLAMAMMTHLGWVTSLYLSITHLLFKGMLFLAIAGIVSRIGTRNMYEMGGLIKRMPLSFISVLIAIIALSGVPPLSGFGGKWLLYTALIERGWYLQAGVAFFASAVAFLYLFRLIHTIFLGQLKTNLRQVKEPSLWYIVPQFLFIGGIMAISMYPNLILKPLMSAVQGVLPGYVQWDGYSVISSLGYWNGNAVMMVTMGVFMVPLLWLLLRVKEVQKVQQFNIVFAAERPETPETTHFAYNFFSHYKKALGFLVQPLVHRFWTGVSEACHSVAAALRHYYTGDGQTYALHILLFAVLLFAFMGVY
jgi:formate hydrogenlyase subunit 3/multisubunit Na+/H+ antiporter MnhD subunit